MKISLDENLKQLPLPATEKWPQGVWDIEAFKHGSMSLILFAPQGNDYQTPHDQDELYIVVSGTGILESGGVPHQFKTGDVLFVPAKKAHRFIEFSSDIQMWAVFWGKSGGESC